MHTTPSIKLWASAKKTAATATTTGTDTKQSHIITFLNPADYLAGFFIFYIRSRKTQTMKRLAAIFLFLFAVANTAYSQLHVDNLKKVLPKIQEGPTYVVVGGDIKSNAAKDYMVLWDKYWPYAKLTFISPGEITKHLNANSSFITIAKFKTDPVPGTNGSIGWAGYRETELKIWTCTKPGSLNSTARDPYSDISNEYSWGDYVARYPFHRVGYDKKAPRVSFPEIFFDPKEEDTEGHTPDTTLAAGFMRNYIQQIILAFRDNKEEWSQERLNKTAVSKLKTDTLYIPRWIVESYSLPEKFFSEYPYPYKVVSRGELNKMLVENSTTFYYLDGHKFPAFIFLKIIDSKTGEVVYLDRSTVTRSYKTEMDKLGKKIGKLK